MKFKVQWRWSEAEVKTSGGRVMKKNYNGVGVELWKMFVEVEEEILNIRYSTIELKNCLS